VKEIFQEFSPTLVRLKKKFRGVHQIGTDFIYGNLNKIIVPFMDLEH
jgi:hypothetical protein